MDSKNAKEIADMIGSLNIDYINASTWFFNKKTQSKDNFNHILSNPSEELIKEMVKIGWFYVKNHCTWSDELCTFNLKNGCCKSSHDPRFEGIWVKPMKKDKQNFSTKTQELIFDTSQKSLEIAPSYFPVTIRLPENQPNSKSFKESYASKVVSSTNKDTPSSKTIITDEKVSKNNDKQDLTKIDDAIDFLQKILDEMDEETYNSVEEKMELVKKLYEELNNKKKEKIEKEKAEQEEKNKKEKSKKDQEFMNKLQEISKIHKLSLNFSKQSEEIKEIKEIKNEIIKVQSPRKTDWHIDDGSSSEEE
jgi:hypothetical protein